MPLGVTVAGPSGHPLCHVTDHIVLRFWHPACGLQANLISRANMHLALSPVSRFSHRTSPARTLCRFIGHRAARRAAPCDAPAHQPTGPPANCGKSWLHDRPVIAGLVVSLMMVLGASGVRAMLSGKLTLLVSLLPQGPQSRVNCLKNQNNDCCMHLCLDSALLPSTLFLPKQPMPRAEN